MITVEKKLLIKEYLINHKNCKEVGLLLGCSSSTIARKLKLYDIPIRNNHFRKGHINEKSFICKFCKRNQKEIS